MPDRILRAELLESEAWLSLKDNTDRAAWIACFLTVDNFGDMPAGPMRMMRLWRPYGVNSEENVAKVSRELADVDLIRCYECDNKPYLHIPRFGQNLRYLGHVWPLSPWATDEEKQRLAQKSHVKHMRSHVNHGESHVDVDVDVEEKQGSSSTSSGSSKITSKAHVGGASRFVCPTLEQLRAYVTEHKLNCEPQAFMDYFVSVGWTVGKGRPMKNWQAAARNWSRRQGDKPLSPTELLIKGAK